MKYENFRNFNRIVKFILYGRGGFNGFIYTINYIIDHSNNFDIIMKTSNGDNADNVFYEYNIGLCINAIKKYFPNFIYTFLFFNLKTELFNILVPENQDRKEWDDIECFKANIMNIKKSSDPYTITRDEYINACKNSTGASTLIEKIPNGIKIEALLNHVDFCGTPASHEIYNYNLFSILFQIYASISSLKKVYTHYDLHEDNIMFVYLPEITKIRYKINKDTFTILTNFIPVIIDYGRSFADCSIIGSNISVSSTKYANETMVPDCNEYNIKSSFKNDSLHLFKYKPSIKTDRTITLDIREDIGNDDWSIQKREHYINPRVNNISSDMRYIIRISDDVNYHRNSDIIIEYKKIFNNENNPDWYRAKFVAGVKESPSEAGKIKNVGDVMNFLIKYYNNKYIKNIPIGDKDLIFNTIDINCNLNEKVKWSYKTKTSLEAEALLPPKASPKLKKVSPSHRNKKLNKCIIS